jgi:F5/8 type C domain.
MKKATFLFASLMAFAGMLWLSCSKMDDYKQHLKDRKYTGKVDTVLVQPGYKRLQLAFVLNNDPSISRVRVYWSNRSDSAEVSVERTGQADTARLMIEELQEGNYNFEIITLDAEDNRSISTYATGQVFGDSYVSTLNNRVLRGASLTDDGSKVILRWSSALSGEIGLHIEYLDSRGRLQRTTVPASEVVSELPDYEEASQMRFRAIYLPDENAIDTFTTAYGQATLPLFERKLDKSRFRPLLLPTDAPDAYGWIMPFLWDENYGEPGFHTPPGGGLPRWYTIDMGDAVRLHRLKLWQRIDGGFVFNRGNPKTFEVWGSNDPDTDGGWQNWVKLLDGESIKPSGLPLGTVNESDVAYARGGEEFRFEDEMLPAVRYIRFKVVDTWSGEDFTHLLELSLWTRDRL